jgi:hypothetical protein
MVEYIDPDFTLLVPIVLFTAMRTATAVTTIATAAAGRKPDDQKGFSAAFSNKLHNPHECSSQLPDFSVIVLWNFDVGW